MIYALRHALSVLLLPVMAAIVVPVWLANAWNVTLQAPQGPREMVAVLAGMIAMAIGLLLFGASLAHFFRSGAGTLAPWDPPRRLVVSGPYCYVRNPMISGVLFTLIGTALILRSLPHGVWAAVFALMNVTYIPLSEEPGLQHRFGKDYVEYCRHVRRFVPRLRAWTGRREAGG